MFAALHPLNTQKSTLLPFSFRLNHSLLMADTWAAAGAGALGDVREALLVSSRREHAPLTRATHCFQESQRTLHGSTDSSNGTSLSKQTREEKSSVLSPTVTSRGRKGQWHSEAGARHSHNTAALRTLRQHASPPGSQRGADVVLGYSSWECEDWRAPPKRFLKYSRPSELVTGTWYPRLSLTERQVHI